MRVLDMVSCPECKVFRHETDYEDWDVLGLPIKHEVCSECRSGMSKTCVDCFACGAVLFFTEQQLDTKASLNGVRVMTHPNGHYIMFKNNFVMGSCWTLDRLPQMTDLMNDFIEAMPIRTE